MPYYLCDQKCVRVVIRARDSEAALKKFVLRFPAMSGVYTVKTSRRSLIG